MMVMMMMKMINEMMMKLIVIMMKFQRSWRRPAATRRPRSR